MDKSIIDNVVNYLFPITLNKKNNEYNESIHNLFKAIYHFENQEYVDSFSGKQLEFVNNLLSQCPKYAKQNLLFAHSLTVRSMRMMQSLGNLRSLDDDQQEKSKALEVAKKRAEKVVDNDIQKQVKAILQDTNQEFGIGVNPGGDENQNTISKVMAQEAEAKIGLEAGTGNANRIAGVIRSFDVNAKRLQKTLCNISAISEALLNGLEKIKSDFADSGYDFGRDLRHLDTRELSYLQDERFKSLFLLKYAKGDLLQETSEDKKGLGDMVIAIDTSSSTDAEAHDGKVLDLEIGIAVAIASLAIKNKCKVRFLFFCDSVYADSEWLLGRQQINKWLAQNLPKIQGGGTSFNQVLRTQHDILANNQYSTKRKPGLIFITDGYANVSDEIQGRITALKKKLGVKLYSYFAAHNDPRNRSQQLLGISTASYWINASEPIIGQIENFKELL